MKLIIFTSAAFALLAAAAQAFDERRYFYDYRYDSGARAARSDPGRGKKPASWRGEKIPAETPVPCDRRPCGKP